MYLCMHIRICVCMSVCLSVCLSVRVFVCRYVCRYACMRRTYIRICECMRVRMYVTTCLGYWLPLAAPLPLHYRCAPFYADKLRVPCAFAAAAPSTAALNFTSTLLRLPPSFWRAERELFVKRKSPLFQGKLRPLANGLPPVACLHRLRQGIG